MGRNKKVDWLNRYAELSRRIRVLKADAEELRDTFGFPERYRGKEYRNSDLCRRLHRQFQKIAQEEQQAIEIQNKIKHCIEAVPDADARELLRMRYINGMGWEQIANALYMDAGYVRGKKHQRALSYIKYK